MAPAGDTPRVTVTGLRYTAQGHTNVHFRNDFVGAIAFPIAIFRFAQPTRGYATPAGRPRIAPRTTDNAI